MSMTVCRSGGTKIVVQPFPSLTGLQESFADTRFRVRWERLPVDEMERPEFLTAFGRSSRVSAEARAKGRRDADIADALSETAKDVNVNHNEVPNSPPASKPGVYPPEAGCTFDRRE